MAKNCEHPFLIQHQGTEQQQRYRASLAPGNLNLNDFDLKDWMQFAYTFANEVHYFHTTNAKNPQGNWQQFFIETEAIDAFIKNLQSSQKTTPHLTLFICFLKLLETSKRRFNTLTQRHLNFYYGKVLQIAKKAPIEDSVHLIFELAKNTSEARIEANTLIEGGKDSEGKRMQYQIINEHILNKTGIGALKSIYHHRNLETGLQPYKNGLYVAPMVNSADGMGAKFKEDPYWLPFGYPSPYRPETPLPAPTIGFTIAAEVLNLQEGKRTIVVQIEFVKNITAAFNLDKLMEAFTITATGEEGWLELYPSEIATNTATIGLSGKHLTFTVVVEKTEKSIVPFQKKIHEASYSTSKPLLRFLLNTTSETGYAFYTQVLQKTIKKVTVSVDVSEATSLVLKNDLGPVASDKPFPPFGTQPTKHSSFYIDYPELFQKSWKSFRIKAIWANTPASFVSHYSEYKNASKNAIVTTQDYFKAKLLLEQNGTFTDVKNSAVTVFKPSPSQPVSKTVIPTENPAENLPLFSSTSEGHAVEFRVSKQAATKTPDGPLKVRLKHSFLHEIYPKTLTLALVKDPVTTVPNAPYLPVIESISLSYQASDTAFIAASEKNETLQLFHEHPFGQAAANETLLPTYCSGGELYIGLTSTEPLQQVTFLFKLLEGTENPDTPPFTASEKIEYAILIQNKWFPLDSTYLIGDTTDNFLKTGIVTITIPPDANDDNSLLPSGMIWLRVKNIKQFDSVCRFLDVHTQVITASFLNQNNSLNHLKTGLPPRTISKLTERKANVKGVSQPYNSFGGSPEESDSHYYQRVSERIRHRDRAVSLWDYEHLILQQFPEIHKVKCLNHTQGNRFLSAGNLNLVVIPDIVHKNAFDVYQPRVSTAQRNEIETYINKLNSFFVTAAIVNPDYEEVVVSLGVKFNAGFDANYYTKQIEEDIKRFLSPWAFVETAELNFGVTFHKSNLISYLEEMPYVDYLDSVWIDHRINATTLLTDQTNIIPSSAKAILVSAKKHSVTAILSSCDSKSIKKAPQCLP